jgi:hypothetical protein
MMVTGRCAAPTSPSLFGMDHAAALKFVLLDRLFGAGGCLVPRSAVCLLEGTFIDE